MADSVNKQSFGEKARIWFKKAGVAIRRFFVNCGVGIKNFFVKIGTSIADWAVHFHRMFVDGSIGTKLSYFILGSGNLSRGQIVKGLIFLSLQVLFILYMVLCPGVEGANGILTPTGYKSLINLKLQGSEPSFDENFVPVGGDDPVLMLLFGILTIVIMIIYVLIWIVNIKSSYAADVAVKEGKKPTSFIDDCKNLLDSKFHILMLSPTCIASLCFTVLPTIFMISMAFTTYNSNDMNALDTTQFTWNGLDNFVSIFSTSKSSTLGEEISKRFLPVFGWTIIWAILATLTCYFGGILLALLINKKGLKGKKIFRFVFVLTIAIPQFVSLLAVKNMLASSGPINGALKDMGWITEPIPWLGGAEPGTAPILAKAMIIIINMWIGIPYTMLMTSGILMNIPADLYEAARVDGTSKPKMFFKITLPYVIFVTTPYLIGSFIGNINSFNTIFLLTGGGPGPVIPGTKAGETDLLVTWLYNLTIVNGDYNTGAVIGIFTFIITSVITLITYRRSKAYKEEDTFQ